jgi:hypothetical protein
MKKHVLHPLNAGGSTWLTESDLVFINEEPFAVVKGKHLPLNPQLLHHEDGDLSHYRYEIELKEPFTHQ